MENIFLKGLGLLLVAVLSIGTAGCSSDNDPADTPDNPNNADETEATNVSLNVNLNFSVPISERETLSRVPTESGLKQRFIVEAYRNRQVAARKVELTDIQTQADASVTVSLDLPAKEYRIVVWSDFVEASGSDYYYQTQNLIPVLPASESYVGNVEYKDAYSASAEVDLTEYNGSESPSASVSMALSRPLARYSLTATDVAAFLRRIASGKVTGSTFTARVTYTSYFSVGYNAYDDVPKQSLKNVAYTTTFRTPEADATELDLAFDYVFVNSGEISQIPLKIEILDEQNNVIAVASTRVTCERDKQTTVRGRFLTTDANGGVNIDPDFDGKINIDLGPL